MAILKLFEAGISLIILKAVVGSLEDNKKGASSPFLI